MSVGVALSGIVIVLSFGWAVRGHFASRAMPPGMRVITIVSALTAMWLLWLSAGAAPAMAIAGLALQWTALALFIAAIRASRGHGLKLAFDATPGPAQVLRAGPYRFVRHPFYLAYSLFWVAWALAVWDWRAWPPVLALLALYVIAAQREERDLLAGPGADAYRAYRASTGALLPRLFSRHAG